MTEHIGVVRGRTTYMHAKRSGAQARVRKRQGNYRQDMGGHIRCCRHDIRRLRSCYGVEGGPLGFALPPEDRGLCMTRT